MALAERYQHQVLNRSVEGAVREIYEILKTAGAADRD
jgi:hypothetical protein